MTMLRHLSRSLHEMYVKENKRLVRFMFAMIVLFYVAVVAYMFSYSSPSAKDAYTGHPQVTKVVKN
ncbi:hypothetical protein [Acinetobacter brisouii]|nr:hypothetical protein [Acinetobacter brisouii]